MKIRKLRVSNFRSFRDLEIELDNFNVLIGANASGKSNFVEIFKFLRDITNHGLQNAVSMQGGIEYLTNVTAGLSRPLSVEVTCEEDGKLAMHKQEMIIGAQKERLTYEFTIMATNDNGGFRVGSDRMTRKYQFFELQEQNGNLDEKKTIGSGEVSLSNVEGTLKYSIDLSEGLSEIDAGDLLLFAPTEGIEEIKLPLGSLLLETPFVLTYPVPTPIFDSIRVYDFDPKLPRRSTPITGKTELEEDGSNLAIALKSILGDSEKKRMFSNLVGDLLPFVDDLRTEKFMDKSLTFTMRESYHDTYLPASLLSDGTINLAAMIIALYFEERPVVVFEEPGRNIHPSLIAKMVSMMEEVSEKKQAIVTTHNPQIVKYADLGSLLLISRDEQGFSTVSRPAHRDDVKTFLANDIGVDDLFVNGLLEA